MPWVVYKSEFKKNLKLAYPVMIASLGHLAVGFVDDIMVGHLSHTALAATSLANGIIFIAMSISIGFSFGIPPLVAASYGKNQKNVNRYFLQHSNVICLFLGIFFSFLLLILTPFIDTLNQPKEVVELALPYYTITSLSLIPLLLFQSFKQFSDGLGLTQYGMKATIYMNIINITINFFLIYGLWIFPKLGVQGASIGTLISRISMVFIIYYLLYKNTETKYFLKIIPIRKYKILFFKKITRLGIPSALQLLCETGIFTSAIIISGIIGTKAQAANQIANKLVTTTYMIVIGVSIASTIRIGHYFGRKDFNKLFKIAFSNLQLIILITLGFTFVLLSLKQILPKIFTTQIQVVEIASKLLVFAGIFQVFDGLQSVLSGILRGMQDITIPSLLLVVSYWVIAFPICYYLGIYTQYKSQGIWLGLLIGIFAATLMLYSRFIYIFKKQKTKLFKIN